MCILACPFGAPSFDPIERVTMKCDLCGGDPECVKLCSSEALKFVRADKVGVIKKRLGVEKLFKAMGALAE
jgi:Fe-S-cluster-containing dehydrogenase component